MPSAPNSANSSARSQQGECDVHRKASVSPAIIPTRLGGSWRLGEVGCAPRKCDGESLKQEPSVVWQSLAHVKVNKVRGLRIDRGMCSGEDWFNEVKRTSSAPY